MVKEITDKELQQQLDKLPKEITPDRDLWAGIEKATQHKKQITEQQNKAFVPGVWAASLMAAVLVTWLTLTPNEAEHQLVQQDAAVFGQVKQEQVELVTVMQNNFLQQKQAMLVSFGQPDMSQLPAEMQVQLEQLAAARKSIRKALESDANNMDLLNLLDFTQQQELRLIQQLYRPQLQSI